MDEGYCQRVLSPKWGCQHDTCLSAADVRVGSQSRRFGDGLRHVRSTSNNCREACLDQINGTIDAFDGAAVRTVSWAKAVPIPTSAMIILHVLLSWSPRSRNAVQFTIDP